jgi:hypothetical protein
MSFVFLVAPAQFARGRHSGQSLNFNVRWRYAEQVDSADGYRTWPETARTREPVRVARVPLPHRFEFVHESVDDRRQVASCTLLGFRDAAERSERGEIGVMLGHGGDFGGQLGIELAPAEAVIVNTELLRYLSTPRDTRSATEARTVEANFFEDVGAVLRAGGVRRVDFYTCNLGVGDAGQALLDAIHQHWQIPVRGLQGFLTHGFITWGSTQLDDMGSGTQVWVDPTSADSWTPRPRAVGDPAGYGLRFDDELVEGPGLWRTSRAPRRRR